MWRFSVVGVCALAALLVLGASAIGARRSVGVEVGVTPVATGATFVDATPLAAARAAAPDEAPGAPAASLFDAVSEQGQRARGLYFTEQTTRRLGAAGIIHAVHSAGLDAAVIDLKDQDGRVIFDTHVDLLAAERHVMVPDMPGLVAELKRAGVYTIARLACFSDPVLPRVHPELAVMDSRPERAGEIWNQRHTNTWLDPYNPQNHAWLIALSVEVERLGFDEIQLDYIRFPVDRGTKFARFPAQSGASRSAVLIGLLRRIDEALHVPLGVDVFGETALRRGDPEGLGQSLDEWAPYVEVFSPMLYVNGMKPWLRKHSQGRAGLLVELAVHALRERVGQRPVIRPFLQAFPNGADYFNDAFIVEQIHGARVGGGDGFLFWNPYSSYALVRSGMAAGGRAEREFDVETRRQARVQGVSASQARAALEAQPEKPSI